MSGTEFTVTVEVKREGGSCICVRTVQLSLSDINSLKKGDVPTNVQGILLDGESAFMSQLSLERKTQEERMKKCTENGLRPFVLYTRFKGKSVKRQVVWAKDIEEADLLIAHMGWWYDYGEKNIHEFEEWKGELPSEKVLIASELLNRPSRFR